MAKVSIIMGVFNGANKVEKSVRSLLCQTFTDFELIICDDGSTDNTYDILCNLKRLDKRIIIIKNKVNKQLAYTLNKCIEISTGTYIARMDDDDYSHPDRLKKQVDFLDTHKEFALVGTSINYIDKNGIWGTRIVSGKVSAIDILKGKTFVHPSVMICSHALKAVGGYNTSDTVRRTEDLDLWVRLYNKGFLGYNLSDILLDYYEDSKSTKKRKYKFRICEFNIRRKARKQFKIPILYFPYVIKPLFTGLFPNRLIIFIHKNAE